MSRKPHQIVQNDVRFSPLPAAVDAMDHGLGPENPGKKRQAKAGRRASGHLQTALPTGAVVAGLYRTQGEGQCPNDVRVLSNGCSFFITEAEYRQRECQPFFEDLPWHGTSAVQTTGGKR